MSIDPITALLDVGKMAITRIWPDPTKQAEEQRKLIEISEAGDLSRLNADVQLLLGQIEVNKIEAASNSLFKSGWRPYVGWICGTGLAYAAILEPIMRFTASVAGYAGEFPVIDTTITMQALMGLLGLGAYRSYEKKNKVN